MPKQFWMTEERLDTGRSLYQVYTNPEGFDEPPEIINRLVPVEGEPSLEGMLYLVIYDAQTFHTESYWLKHEHRRLQHEVSLKSYTRKRDERESLIYHGDLEWWSFGDVLVLIRN